MPYIVDHKQKFTDLNFNIKNQDQLRRQANGGNSILFSYPPIEESLYILSNDNYIWKKVTNLIFILKIKNIYKIL